ncbi:MAG TPA: hypothetical protein EYM77_02730 [Dehalococcoidia bacterium]|nr:hypothetical protein [Dehalococcoidia bacterium]
MAFLSAVRSPSIFLCPTRRLLRRWCWSARLTKGRPRNGRPCPAVSNRQRPAINRDAEREILSRLRTNDPARFLESCEVLSNAEDPPVDYAVLSMPTLVLTGDGDPGSTPRMAKNMAQAMTNARSMIIQGSKHLGIIEEHLLFSDAVNRFLLESGI